MGLKVKGEIRKEKSAIKQEQKKFTFFAERKQILTKLKEEIRTDTGLKEKTCLLAFVALFTIRTFRPCRLWCEGRPKEFVD